MQHLLQAFLPKQNLMVVWLNKAMIDLCQGFCYIKDIRLYIMIQIIKIMLHRNNMVAEKHGSSSESSSLWEFSSPLPLWEFSPLLIVRSPLRFWNLAPRAMLFFSTSFFARVGAFYALSGKEMQNKHKENCLKNKRLSDYIYSIATL